MSGNSIIANCALDGTPCVGAHASRQQHHEPKDCAIGVHTALRLVAAAFTAATLAACAQSPGVSDRRASLGTTRLVAAPSEPSRSAEPSRKPAFVASRANVTRRQAAETQEATNGLASYYGHGVKTANGESYNSRELTAAHKTLPFGTRVRVTNVSTGKSVTVRVNDRGPFVPGRVIDVSQAAAEQLGMVGRGVTKVKLDVVQ